MGIKLVEHEDPLYHVDHIVPVSRGGKPGEELKAE